MRIINIYTTLMRMKMEGICYAKRVGCYGLSSQCDIDHDTVLVAGRIVDRIADR